MARVCTVRFLAALRAVAARGKLRFVLRRGIPQDNELRRRKPQTKSGRIREETKESADRPLVLDCR